MGVLVMRGGKILLGRRKGSHGAGLYAAPGGHIESGESFEAAARREVFEETGLTIKDIRLLSVGNYLFEGERHYIDVDFVCEAPEGQPQLREPEKCDGWAWYDPDQLPAPLFIVTERMIASLATGGILQSLSTVEKQ
ncbi:MAG: nucleotide triphosphate diphosphatase NUDT15 [Blastocatellia bacterium]